MTGRAKPLCRRSLRLPNWPIALVWCILPFGHDGRCSSVRRLTQAEFDVMARKAGRG